MNFKEREWKEACIRGGKNRRKRKDFYVFVFQQKTIH